MIMIEEIQTVGIFIFTFYSIAVATRPIRDSLSMEKAIAIYNKSRVMLFHALVLFTVHFTLQRVFGFRHMPGYQAALVNSIFYTPAFVCLNFSILHLIYQGELKRWHKYLGWSYIGVVYLIFLVTALIDEGGLMSDSDVVHIAQILTSVIGAIVIVIFNVDEWKRFHCISSIVDSYYDAPQLMYVKWFRLSVFVFASLAMVTPVMMYMPNQNIQFVFGIIGYTAIAVLVQGFLQTGADGIITILKAMKENEDTEHANLDVSNTTEVSPIVLTLIQKWLETGHQFQAGITASEIANEIGISRNDLNKYLHSHGYPKIGSWLAKLRIEEAKRLLLSNPEYSHDAIAEQCGFSSREYFQACFRNLVGIPPMQWQKENMK